MVVISGASQLKNHLGESLSNLSHVRKRHHPMQEEAHISGAPLPHIRVPRHHSSKDEPGSTARYAGTTPSIGHHSSSGSPAMGSMGGAINSTRQAPPPDARRERGRGRGTQRNRNAAQSVSPQPGQGNKRGGRKYANNVPRMGRIAWIDNRHTDQKLRSRYAGVTQVSRGDVGAVMGKYRCIHHLHSCASMHACVLLHMH